MTKNVVTCDICGAPMAMEGVFGLPLRNVEFLIKGKGPSGSDIGFRVDFSIEPENSPAGDACDSCVAAAIKKAINEQIK